MRCGNCTRVRTPARVRGGKLTEEEVVAALTRKTGQGTELSEEVARDTWKRWQARFDFDKDGKVSIEELAGAEQSAERSLYFALRHQPGVGVPMRPQNPNSL